MPTLTDMKNVADLADIYISVRNWQVEVKLQETERNAVTVLFRFYRNVFHFIRILHFVESPRTSFSINFDKRKQHYCRNLRALG